MDYTKLIKALDEQHPESYFDYPTEFLGNYVDEDGTEQFKYIIFLN